MSKLNQINNILKHHLTIKNLYPEEKLWNIKESATAGRGIFASRDINPGEIIFIDYPLLIGPRAGSNFTYHCVTCYELNDLYACTKGCGLPICSPQCEQNHSKECILIRRLCSRIFNEIILEIFKCLSPLRFFLINEKLQELFKHFTYHPSVIHGGEIESAKKYFNLKQDEINILKIICSVLDTNTFATVVRKNDKQLSVRALYPLSAFLNHSCCPNVTHLYSDKQEMIVKAAVLIPKDTEIFISYTSLLWGTTLRRLTQFVTKQFWCHCDRCKDPKEFGSNLNGMKCSSEGCDGVVYPIDSLDNFGDWKCENCDSIIANNKIGEINGKLGTILKKVGTKDTAQLISLMTEKLGRLIPPKNYFNYEVKVKIIWCLGYKNNYLWNDLKVEELNLKEKLCLDVLEVLNILKLGLCKMRGLILYELYRTRFELCSRATTEVKNLKVEIEENVLLLKEAAEILENDVNAPQEITDYLNLKK